MEVHSLLELSRLPSDTFKDVKRAEFNSKFALKDEI